MSENNTKLCKACLSCLCTHNTEVGYICIASSSRFVVYFKKFTASKLIGRLAEEFSAMMMSCTVKVAVRAENQEKFYISRKSKALFHLFFGT